MQGLQPEMIVLLWTLDVATDLSDELMQCVRKNQLFEAMEVTRSLSRKELTVIAGRPDKDGRTALTTAMDLIDGLDFVKYLLDSCGADVDQCGFVDYRDDDGYQVVHRVLLLRKIYAFLRVTAYML